MEEKGMMDAKKGVVQMNKIDWKALLKTQTGSILMIVLGAVLAIYPDSASVLVSAVLGWVIIAMGVVMLVGGFLGGPDIGSILQGAFFLVIGAWLHRNPLMIATLLGLLLGVLALRQGWNGVTRAKWIKRSGGFWVPGMVLAVLELIVGVRLILSPMSVSRLVMTIAGIVMVLCGAAELAGSIKGRKYIPGDSRIIDADE